MSGIVAKRCLFVIRRPPLGGSRAREILDQVLAVAAFDQDVRLLFLDDGVYQLLDQQNPSLLGLEPVAPLLTALPLYDVNECWVERESLHERGLAEANLVVPVRCITRGEVAELLAGQDWLVGS